MPRQQINIFPVYSTNSLTETLGHTRSGDLSYCEEQAETLAKAFNIHTCTSEKLVQTRFFFLISTSPGLSAYTFFELSYTRSLYLYQKSEHFLFTFYLTKIPIK